MDAPNFPDGPYEHVVLNELRVGELRDALAGLPDDLPVAISVPAGPTTATLGEPAERLVVTGIAGPIPGLAHDGDQPLVLLAGYPTGRYTAAGRRHHHGTATEEPG